MSAVHEVIYYVEGHKAGRDAFFAARRKGDLWAVIDNKAGGTPDFWTGDGWAPLHGDEPDMLLYRFTQAEAEQTASHNAMWASRVHQRIHTMENARFAAWLAGEAKYYLVTAREAVA